MGNYRKAVHNKNAGPLPIISDSANDNSIFIHSLIAENLSSNTDDSVNIANMVMLVRNASAKNCSKPKLIQPPLALVALMARTIKVIANVQSNSYLSLTFIVVANTM